MSGDKPMYQPQVQGGHEALAQELQKLGLHFEETSGRYNEPERSYIIHGATADQMKHLGKMFGQESVIHSSNGQHRLVYTNGPDEGKFHPSQAQQPIEHFEQPPQDFYTAVPGHGYMRINFDWNQKQPLEHAQAQQAPAQPAPDTSAPMGKREYEPADAAYLAKNAVAQLLTAQAPRYAHPHAYPWHDGHTDHHVQVDHGGPQLPGLAKADPDYAESQRPQPGSGEFKKFSLPHGEVHPGSNPNLNFYRYEGKLPEAVKLAQDHGYKHYFAGGKYGKPDLANKNYNTGHLMVYDPGDQKGRIAHNRDYATAYSVVHELAHALTLPEVNKIYGEGRRLGKLGVHRTLHEALRAVHWEHLATQKQRELSKQIGVNLSDDDFHRDRNTVMSETVMRAVTGRFTEPNNEGFHPHARPVPLHVSLQMVRDAAHEMGLKGMHETIKKSELTKAFPNKSTARDAPVISTSQGPNGPNRDLRADCWKCGRNHRVARTEDIRTDGRSIYKCPECVAKDKRGGGPGKTQGVGAKPEAQPSRLDLIRQAAMRRQRDASLKDMIGDEPTEKSMQKNLPLKSPAAAGVTRAPATQPAAPADHVGNFMTQLKAMRGDNVARGKHITQAMSNPDFIGALQAHPQGKQIHAMLTNHLNSTANAGPKAPMKVVAKSEPNLSKAEGDTVAEKTYTVEEANEILLKATQEKVSTFAKEIKALRERELKKALIPPHKHNQGSQASMASEDIPPGKLNPKGVDKSKVEKNALMGYGPGSPPVAGGGAAMAMAEQNGEMCKGCKLGKKMCKCMSKTGQDGTKIIPPSGGAEGDHADAQAKMAEQVKKADLVSENGKRTDNHTAPGAKEIPKGTKEIERGSKKDPGSGGIQLPGSKLKKDSINPSREDIGPSDSEPEPKATRCKKCGSYSSAPRDEKGLCAECSEPVKKNAAPPMAKPPSGKNMGTAVPTSAPKPPAMKAELQKDAGGFAKPQFASQPGHPSQPAGAGYGASGHQITQPIPKRKVGAGNAGSIGGLTPSDQLTQQDTVSRVKTPVMGIPGAGAGRRPENTISLPGAHLTRPQATVSMKSDLDMEKGVDKIVVHGDKPSQPPKGADYTSSKQGDKAVYETKKPELAKAALPNQNAAAMAGPVGGGGPDLIPSDPAPKPAAKPQYMHPNHAALAAGAKPLTPAQPKLASPKAAGATRAAGPLAAKPAAPAAAPNPAAAKPAGAKPGIFGKLFGGK